MKKIILISLIAFSLSQEHQNPNGNPFTLNIAFEYVPVKYHQYERSPFECDVNMPLSKYFTLKFGFKNSKVSSNSEKSSAIVIHNENPPYNSSNYHSHQVTMFHHNHPSTLFDAPYIGADFHFPIYKLWE